MLARMHPFRDLRTAEDEIDRLFGRALSRDTWMPPLDVNESDDGFEVKVDLPGLGPDDVNVTFEDGMLTVGASGSSRPRIIGQTWHRVERGFGTFARSIRLPQTPTRRRSRRPRQGRAHRGRSEVGAGQGEDASGQGRGHDGRTARPIRGRRRPQTQRPPPTLPTAPRTPSRRSPTFDSRPPGGPPSDRPPSHRAQSDAAAEGTRRRRRYRPPAPR